MNELSKRLWSADCWLRCTELLINAYEQNKPYDLICRLKRLIIEIDKYSDSQPRDEHGRWTSGESGESNLSESQEFHCYGDYLRDYLGSAKDNNPEEFAQIKDDVESKGGRLILSKENPNMVCNIRRGEPGIIQVDENISIAGLKHEYRHFLDDMENGNPGLAYYLKDKDIFFEYERRGYEEELNIAREFGYKDAEQKILKEIENRRRDIYGE